jgi:hypothetical protein
MNKADRIEYSFLKNYKYSKYVVINWFILCYIDVADG